MKNLDSSKPTVSPTSTSMSGSESTASGARFGTATRKLCVAARPSVSVAVTAIVAVPFATARTTTSSPETATPATPPCDDSAL